MLAYIPGKYQNSIMTKVQNILELQPELPLSEYNFYSFYQESFKTSLLGKIHGTLPLHQMAIDFGLVDESTRTKRGRKSYFTPEGKIALMFLRMYTALSAPKLLEQLNSNIHYQIFCGIVIDPLHPLTNYKIIDDISLELARKLKIQTLQKTLADFWKPYMKNLDTLYTDATCYESQMRFPTDAKLIWECVEKSHAIMCAACHRSGENKYRTKYDDVAKARLVYAKKRRHSAKSTHHIILRMLKLLKKILVKIRSLLRNDDKCLKDNEKRLITIITQVSRQQKNHFESSNQKESIKNRIVSVSKPYVRPIVRGKEIKKVEFGAKCNNIQIDGISFIEKLSFNAFSEGPRLAHCIYLSKKLFGVKVKKIAGDQGYASNANRKLCKEKNIETSFSRKGPAGKDEDEKKETRQELARVRATSMEGSFGTQKNHYNLNRVIGRLKVTEILMIFFGIHTSNVVLLAERRMAAEAETKKKKVEIAA